MKLLPLKPVNRRNQEQSEREDVTLDFDMETVQDLVNSRTSLKSLHSDSYVNRWVKQNLQNPRLRVRPIPLRDMEHWHIEPESGNITHSSGKFFSITGVKVRHRAAAGELEWDQPIIDQPEVGILGILATKIDGILHFCLQAKEEPGNINSIQLSPTVQATFSNYTRVHGGNPPPFVQFFLAPPPEKIIFAKLQTEDGGRFLFKSNRNMIVKVDPGELRELPPHFIWLTLHQISRLLRHDNLTHACTRSILSSLLFLPAPCRDTRSSAHSLKQLIQWLDDQKASNHILVRGEGLDALKEWKHDETSSFSHIEKRFFRVVGIRVSSTGREVPMWDQPILANLQTGIIGILMRRVAGERLFLMQAKPDVGNRSIIQLGPTVQFTPANYLNNIRLSKPFLFDEFMGNGSLQVVTAAYQSEEGARFFQEQHLHRILELPEDMELEIPPEFRWFSESQVRFFIHMGESVNSCARSVLSCLL